MENYNKAVLENFCMPYPRLLREEFGVVLG